MAYDLNWPLRTKILFGYGLVLLLLAIVFIWAFMSLHQLGSTSDTILSENYRSILAADNMIGSLERQESGTLLYLLGLEDQGIQQFQRHQSIFQQWLGRAKDNITIEGEQQILEQLERSYDAYLGEFTAIMQQPPPVEQAYSEQMQPRFTAVREACEDLRRINQQTMEQASIETQHLAQQAMWSVGGISLAALLLGFAFSITLSRRIVRPIRHLQDATEQLAEGRYDTRVEVTSTDELGALALQFNEMAGQLQSFQEMNLERVLREQQKSNAIIQGMADGLIVLGTDLRVQDINPAAEQALDIRQGSITGRHVLEVIDDEPLLHSIQQAVQYQAESQRSLLENGTHATRQEHVITVRRDGQKRHLQYDTAPITGPNEERIGAIVLLRDVTKFKELDRLKSEFVATASHQLKTPLTSIGMSIGLLQESGDSNLAEEDRELLRAAQEDVERLRRLIQDLLDLSKIEAGKIDLQMEAVPISLLFDKTMQPLAGQAQEQEVTLKAATVDDLPPVRADASKIAWVLTNLVSNALRYTDPGGSVQLAAECIGEKVHVSVTDDGHGIPYEHQARIFDKFVQVEGAADPQGSGLGLAISREMVQAHGGSIWVDSARGKGSTFTFTLPLASS